jgi:site-specific recombinase XerC
VLIKKLKNNNTYTRFLQDELLDKFKEICSELNINDYVVHLKKGKKMTSRQIQNCLHLIINEFFNQGLEKDDSKNRTVIYKLRLTFGSHLAIKETPIFTIKELMNYSDIEQTIRYAKFALDSGKKMCLIFIHKSFVDSLDQFLF